MGKSQLDVDPSTLYVVATPIGNLGDISSRALQIIENVSLVAAEDTRHTRRLLSHFGVKASLVSLHDQNEIRQCKFLVNKIQQGASIALVSDAGTPLISDPGYRLVRAVRASGFEVRAVPGASAITAALSICGLPINRFVFEGFLPTRSPSRRSRLLKLVDEERTMVLFESPRRLISSLGDIQDIFGPCRQLSVVREITKKFESVIIGTVHSVIEAISVDQRLQQGEVVLVIDGADKTSHGSQKIDPATVGRILVEHLPPRVASEVAAKIVGGRKNDLYRLILELAEKP
ncbi:MAG: 16S rRNA (cytidine(1402)-2'-O)-methyltransferase [Acidiferrobacteraceae bacterium]|nr:16S rRNA (cytidine(1402)-2'-O)-methyltransferase [Acidiferrobacteraceae bacterium]